MSEPGRALDPARGAKPLDFGGDGVTGSVDADGRLIALNAYHPRCGYVTLTSADPFSEEQRYNPAAVRQYRAGLAALTGFGPDLGEVTQREAQLIADAIPALALTRADGAPASVITWAEGGGAFQLWTLPEGVRWRGRISLQRCAYTQLTEGGPVPMPPAETQAAFNGGALTVENPALGMAAAVTGFAPGRAWQQRAAGPIEVDLPCAAGASTLVYAFGPDAASARAEAQRLRAQAEGSLARQVERWQSWLAGAPEPRAVRRGLVYGRMLAVPVGEAVCLLTDHMLLPLAWNRDAYYTARALLGRAPDLVRRHLRWMFETAERPGGEWGRCYLANGRVKDAAFQLDQQVFPLLELAEYTQATGDRATWDRLYPAAASVIETLLARRAPGAWLFPTDETPADDPLPLPYHFSSHVLLWHTLRLFGAQAERADLLNMAERVRAAALEHFTARHGDRTLFAYATDGGGHFHFYHDANDFPLALAPAWGFVPASDPVWRATVEFAFSEANEGGCYGGRLGSVHTRAPWPLGDVQELIIARALDDPARAERAWARLDRAAQWDGALPEATDAATGAVVSRHWFAWPNAALACVVLGVFG